MLLFLPLQAEAVNIGTADLWAGQGGILGLIVFALLTLLSVVIIFSFIKLAGAITGLTTAFNDRRLSDSESMANVRQEIALVRQQMQDNKQAAHEERLQMADMMRDGFAAIGKTQTKMLIEMQDARNKNKQ